jgi:hypothetical protein
LVPVREGGSPLLAQILLLNISLSEAKDRLWLGRAPEHGRFT